MTPRKEYYTLPRQEFPPAFSGNGYVDIIKTSTILNDDLFYGDKILAFDTGYVNEVDTLDDFKNLEKSSEIKDNQIFKYLKKKFLNSNMVAFKFNLKPRKVRKIHTSNRTIRTMIPSQNQ